MTAAPTASSKAPHGRPVDSRLAIMNEELVSDPPRPTLPFVVWLADGGPPLVLQKRNDRARQRLQSLAEDSLRKLEVRWTS
jgi:hypothetical protein